MDQNFMSFFYYKILCDDVSVNYRCLTNHSLPQIPWLKIIKYHLTVSEGQESSSGFAGCFCPRDSCDGADNTVAEAAVMSSLERGLRKVEDPLLKQLIHTVVGSMRTSSRSFMCVLKHFMAGFP